MELQKNDLNSYSIDELKELLIEANSEEKKIKKELDDILIKLSKE